MAALCWNWQPLDGIPLFPLWFSSLCFVACLWGMFDQWAKIMLDASYFLPGIWPGWYNQPASLNKSPRLWISWGELNGFSKTILSSLLAFSFLSLSKAFADLTKDGHFHAAFPLSTFEIQAVSCLPRYLSQSLWLHTCTCVFQGWKTQHPPGPHTLYLDSCGSWNFSLPWHHPPIGSIISSSWGLLRIG